MGSTPRWRVSVRSGANQGQSVTDNIRPSGSGASGGCEVCRPAGVLAGMVVVRGGIARVEMGEDESLLTHCSKSTL